MKSLIICLALLATIASAARLPDLQFVEEDLPESLVAFQDAGGANHAESDNDLDLGFAQGSLYSSLEDILTEAEVQKKEKWPIRIATKHLVKPALHGNFVRQFWRFQAKSKDIKGVRYIGLSKVAGDNIVWTSYAVYADFEGLIKHAKSEALRDFASYLMNANIAVKTNLLFRIAGGYYGEKAVAVEMEETGVVPTSTPGADNKKKGWPVRLLTAYIVRPGEHCGFIKAWKKMEAKVADSKGLVALSLSKPAGDNILFTSYAHFDSPSALWSLGEKKAVKQFLEYVSDKGITVVTRKMWKVPEPKW
jgi:hypothetical protein